MKMEDIRGAVARGWCAPENSAKEMDVDLAEAISLEVNEIIQNQTVSAKTAIDLINCDRRNRVRVEDNRRLKDLCSYVLDNPESVFTSIMGLEEVRETLANFVGVPDVSKA